MTNEANITDSETGQPFTTAAKEIYPEPAEPKPEKSMTTEAELLQAAAEKKVDPTPDILFGVVYTQDSLQAS